MACYAATPIACCEEKGAQTPEEDRRLDENISPLFSRKVECVGSQERAKGRSRAMRNGVFAEVRRKTWREEGTMWYGHQGIEA
jgi:hypothetical protein